MIFDLTKAYVPEAYVDSRDYRTFLRQLGMLTTVFKYNIDHFPDLYDAFECPEHLLPLLASMVGYDYKSEKYVKHNRKIIQYFPYLIRNRGSRTGIKLAVILCINTDQDNTKKYSASHIIVEPDVENGIINIYYPRVNVIDWDLIEVVRPVGMRINLIQSDMAFLTEELDIKDRIKSVRRNEYYDESDLGESQVGFSVNDEKIRERNWDDNL